MLDRPLVLQGKYANLTSNNSNNSLLKSNNSSTSFASNTNNSNNPVGVSSGISEISAKIKAVRLTK
jgi:hypothetical protein